MRTIHPAACVLPALLLAACATPLPPHQALPDTARSQIASSDVVVPIKQSEIYVFVPTSSSATVAMGGGLLGALVDAGIDSVRTSKAEKAVKPLRDALVDFSFDQTMQKELATSLSQVAWMKSTSPRVVKEVTDASLDGALAASKADAVLYATVDYQLSNDASILDISMTSDLFANNSALQAMGPKKTTTPKTAPANALYRNTLTYEVAAPHATVDRDQNIAIWSTENGAAMRSALNSGAVELAHLLAEDLQGQQDGGNALVAGASTMSPKGEAVTTDGGGKLVRANDGTLKYFAAPSR